MDPLTAIKQWYNAGEEHMREELVFLVQQFHMQSSLNSLPAKTRMKEFDSFMNSSLLHKAEIVQRAIFMKGLINFGLSGRDTEQGWERARQKNEELSHKLHANGKATGDTYSEFMRNYSIRKANWIAWCNVWRSLEHDVLSDDQIGYWYYVEEAIKKTSKMTK